MSKLKTTVEEFTTPSPITASPKDSLENIKTIMESNGIRHVPIVDNNMLVGMISDRDLKLGLALDVSSSLKAEEIMVQEVCTVSCNTSLEEAAFKMSQEKIGSLLIEDNEGNIYGIFTSTDALNALIEIARGELK